MNSPSSTLAHPARRKLLLALSAIVAVAGLAYGVYWVLVLNHYESTDDAYVQGNIVQVTPQIAGTVVEVGAQDTDFVKAGQVLVRLDPSDATVALEQAKAQLAQTVREVKMMYANDSALQADLAFRRADAARVAAELSRAEQDLRRRKELAAKEVISKEDLAHANSTVNASKSEYLAALAAVDESRRQLQSNRSLTQGVAIGAHPKVLSAAANVHEAYLTFQRTLLPSPVTGYVAKRNVQIGQRLQPGANLMSIIALDQLWVDANFKEVQLRKMRIGQPVTMSADVYGQKVTYHGKVAGLGAGTGAAFALLPAQNATGNWIKVVQRVPVRIELDPEQLREHPLRIGLSMLAEVDISENGGKPVASATSSAIAANAHALSTPDRQADMLVQQIIANNLNNGTTASVSAR